MTDPSPAVCYADLGPDVASALAPDLPDRFDVTAVADPERALAELPATDCLVVVCRDPDDDALELVERAAERAPETPRLVATDGAEGIASAALDAGATDCVTAGGPDRAPLLGARIDGVVEAAELERDHRETLARFEALTENTEFAVVTIDGDSTVRFASDAVEDLFGYAPAELEGGSLTAVMPERFHDAHHAAVDRYLDTGDRALDWDWIELPGKRRDGTEFPLGVSFGERSAGDDHLFTAVLRDITDQQARTERLDRVATALEESMDGVALLDEDGRFDLVNEAHAAIYGYDDPEALIGEHWRTLYESEETERFESEVLPTIAESGEWRGEATGMRADGSTFPQELSLTRLDDGGLVCVVRDITDRVERRRELESEREFVDTVIDTLTDVFYVLDTEGRFVRWNDRLASVTGYTDAELDGMHALAVIPPEHHERVAEVIDDVVTEDADRTVRSALLSKQGDRTPYEFTGSQLTDADGEVVGLAGIGRDITDERLREQRLAVLSRVLRHNVRNRLTVVLAQAEHIAEAGDDEGIIESARTVQRAAAQLSEASERAHRAESLLRERPARQRIDLVAAVDRGIERSAADRAAVDCDLPARAPVVATPSVDRAVAELLTNAATHVSDPTISVSVDAGDEQTTVRVADDGPGLPDHELAVLAGATETALEHSTGLGLWLVTWLVTMAGGQTVTADSDLGGTAVELRFPSAD
ncbi:PAS domain S-box protein [Haloarcula litorea]|uniref:PAS domain S-box protein n=1 Tax=Haloarcula litorea TaxID=3032579 RepID=UPI0023E87034|nr:PAS domain S-box protein [Halomicroarcula sp. GDY20]